MSSPPNKTEHPRSTYAFDAIPEDDRRQEELNQRMRKPGGAWVFFADETGAAQYSR